jgi:hypothetical protein
MTGKYQRVTNYTYCLQPCVITIFVYQCNHATEDEEKVTNKNCKKIQNMYQNRNAYFVQVLQVICEC